MIQSGKTGVSGKALTRWQNGQGLGNDQTGALSALFGGGSADCLVDFSNGALNVCIIEVFQFGIQAASLNR
jgi:hypothetical protein